MYSLKEGLESKILDELKNIAREQNISGYSVLKKADLVSLLVQEMKTKEFKEITKEKLNDTMLLLLDLILENGNSKKFYELKINFLDFKSATTFYKTYNNLLDLGLIFNDEDENGEEIIYVPKEFTQWLNQFVSEISVRVRTEESEEDISDEQIEEELASYSSFKTIDGLLYSSLIPIEDLKDILEINDINSKGSKKDLINRILYESNFNLEEILELLISKPVLKEICGNLQLARYGSKADLINRIIEILPLQNPNLVKKLSKPKAKSPGSSAESSKIKALPIIKPQPKKINEENFYENPEQFVAFLRDLKMHKPREEREVEIYLYGVLSTKFGNYKVRREESGRKGSNRYDLTIADTVIIELKAVNSKKKVVEGIGQIIAYLGEQRRYKYGVLGVYDTSTSKNLKSQLQEKYGENVYIVIW